MIIRRKHTANFATISNALANDDRLQADEIGVLYYLLSRPHDWEVRRPQLAKRFGYGREAIKRVMWNTMRCGWVVAQKTQLTDGRFFTVYEVRDEPGPELSDEQIRAALSLGSSEAGEGDTEGDRTGEPTTDPPATGDPPTGQPATAQPATGNPYVAPIEGVTKNGFTKDGIHQSGWAFSDVRAKWPADHVVSSFAAEQAFAALNETMRAACHDGIAPYLAECAAKARKVCDLTTFIRERRWEKFQVIKPSTEMCSIKAYSPEFYRWREYRLAIGDHDSVKAMDIMAKLGREITVPSRWPPPLPAIAS
jgi:predicted transcriptional regulator